MKTGRRYRKIAPKGVIINPIIPRIEILTTVVNHRVKSRKNMIPLSITFILYFFSAVSILRLNNLFSRSVALVF